VLGGRWRSVITDTIYLDRFRMCPSCGVSRDIQLERNTAIVKGVDRLQARRDGDRHPRQRGTVIAALCEGETRISRIYHLDAATRRSIRSSPSWAKIERVRE